MKDDLPQLFDNHYHYHCSIVDYLVTNYCYFDSNCYYYYRYVVF